MSTFERIKELCKSRGITLQELAEKTGMSINALYKWRTSTPSSDKLKKVADYLDISLDYLMGRSESTTTEIKPEEEELIVMFRKNTTDMNDKEKREFNRSLDKLMSVAKELFERDKEE